MTSDAYGAYSFMWTPDIPGKYTVVATFAGSESYWPSYAKTSFGVDEAPEPSVVPTAPASMADLYFMPMSIGSRTATLPATQKTINRMVKNQKPSPFFFSGLKSHWIRRNGAERALDGMNDDHAILDLSFFLSPLNVSSRTPANLQ